jgi:hypothetical protein
MLKKMLCVLFLQFLLIFSVTAQPSDQNGTTILKTNDGYLIVGNNADISYRIEFKGNKIEAMGNDHPVFMLDGKLMQVVSVAKSNFYKPQTGQAKPSETQFLEQHQIWESNYLGEQMKSKLTVKKELLDLNAKKKAMLWSFDMPKEFDSQFNVQMFLTTNLGDNILGINTSLEAKDSQIERRKYLLDAMNTLQISAKPFDIAKISEELKKGN